MAFRHGSPTKSIDSHSEIPRVSTSTYEFGGNKIHNITGSYVWTNEEAKSAWQRVLREVRQVSCPQAEWSIQKSSVPGVK